MIVLSTKLIGRWRRILLCCDAFDAFREVMDTTMKPKLHPNWADSIKRLTTTMDALNLKVTLKMHWMTDHAADFLQNEADGASFCAFSAQAMESAHHRFKPFQSRFNVPERFRKINDISNNSIRRAVCAFNAANIPAAELAAVLPSPSDM